MKKLSVCLLGLLALWACYSPPTVQAECRVLSTPETYTEGKQVQNVCDTHGTMHVTLTDSSGVPATVTTTGATATAAAPTYSEAATVTLSVDLSGNTRVTLGTLLSGEDQTNNLIMTSGGAVRTTQILGTGGVPSTASDATTAASILPTGSKTFVGTVTCTGTCVQTQKIYGDWNSDAASGVLLCTITLSATTTAIDACPVVTANFAYYYVVTTLTSGTTPLAAVFVHY